MYSLSTVNSTAMASLHSCSFRSHSDGSDNESLGDNGDDGDNNKHNKNDNNIINTNDLQRTNGLSRVVTTEHTMSSSQSSLSHSDEPEKETPAKVSTSGSTVGDETVVGPNADSSAVRSRENGKEKEDNEIKDKEEDAHKKVSWQKSLTGDPPTAENPPVQDVSLDIHQQEQSQQQSQTKLESLDIATFPTDKLLEMLTALLDKIVKSNDKLMDTNFSEQQQELQQQQQQSGCVRSVLSFRGKHVPQIGLEQYFQRIQKYCPTSNDVFLSLLVYFDRISRRCNSNSHSHSNSNHEKNATIPPSSSSSPQQFVMDSHNIHRLIIAGTTVSTKFFSDFFYSNSRYARVGGISLQELNHLELQFLILCDFKLLISVNEMQRYADLLYRFWNNSRPQQQPLQHSK